MRFPIVLTVSGGAPRTKKTSNVVARVGGRVRVLPSKAWRDWVRDAVVGHIDGVILTQSYGAIWNGPRFATIWRAIEEPMNCRATFFRDAQRGDAVGYYQGLADLLEKRRIIVNDSLIVSWDGSRLDCDKGRPRVEITLEAA